MKIDSTEISVVVQGAVADVTGKCLLSIRKALPKATIILSTWEGTDVSGLEYDEVVFNKDPGNTPANLPSCPFQKANNVNRQIVSTLNGLKKVTTKYALKMRTDFLMKHAGFIHWFNQFPKRTDEFVVFQHKVVSFSGALKDMIFHPCDFMYFGLTEDLLLLFDIPLQSKEEAFWFKEPANVEFGKYLCCRFIPEQHIWLECLKKKYPEQISKVKSWLDMTDENKRISTISYLNNFIGLECREFGLEPIKKELMELGRHPVPDRLLSLFEYMKLYKNNINNHFKIPLSLQYETTILKIKRFFAEVYRFIMKPMFLPILACLPKEKRQYLRKKLKLKR